MRSRWRVTAAPFMALLLLNGGHGIVTAQTGAKTLNTTSAQAGTLPPSERTGVNTSPGALSPSQLPSAQPPADARPCQSTLLWDGTTLRVDTSNCDLNAVLQQVAAKTGTALTGTAPAERIFGSYGPGTLDAVLSSLLEGVPVNVLLVNRSGSERKELVLSARGGPASPPSQSPREDTSGNTASTRPAGAFGGVRDDVNPPQQLPQLQGGQQPGVNAQQPGLPAASNDGTQASSPNGVKTPQEIFEQLQRLRSQQNQPNQ